MLQYNLHSSSNLFVIIYINLNYLLTADNVWKVTDFCLHFLLMQLSAMKKFWENMMHTVISLMNALNVKRLLWLHHMFDFEKKPVGVVCSHCVLALKLIR